MKKLDKENLKKLSNSLYSFNKNLSLKEYSN